jgi:hypothetical protein
MKNKDKYEIILFSDKTTNRSELKSGYKVGEFLVVSNADVRVGKNRRWRIYRYLDGLACLRTTFLKSEDAIQCAEWLDKTYRDENGESFFFIWNEYPRAELFRWTYLTIENGEKYWKLIERMDKQRNVKWEDVRQYLS